MVVNQTGCNNNVQKAWNSTCSLLVQDNKISSELHYRSSPVPYLNTNFTLSYETYEGFDCPPISSTTGVVTNHTTTTICWCNNKTLHTRRILHMHWSAHIHSNNSQCIWTPNVKSISFWTIMPWCLNNQAYAYNTGTVFYENESYIINCLTLLTTNNLPISNKIWLILVLGSYVPNGLWMRFFPCPARLTLNPTG